MSRKKVRTSRRRAALRRNPLSKRGKILAVGGIAVAGTAAFVLLGPSLASAQVPGGPPLPPGPTGDPKTDKIAECTALAANLATLKARPGADAGAIRQLEQQVAACIAEARSMGAEIPADAAALSDGDSQISYLDSKFGEYKATDYSDALKRNNLRVGEILGKGEAMVAALATAVAQSTSDALTTSARMSIVRAIESSVLRRLCYLYDQPGCGRFGVNEDHGNDKAAAEQNRILTPLLAAHTAAVAKLGGPTSSKLSAETTDKFLDVLTKSCATAKAFVDAKFGEYKATDYSDAVKRNNLRQEVLRHGGDLVACLRSAYQEAKSYNNLKFLRQVANQTIAALDAASARRLCYLFDQPGCGRFGVNEDHSNDKGKHEYDRTVKPLTDLYMQIAADLVRMGDKKAYGPLVTSKLGAANTTRSYINAKFGEYKATNYADAVKRNNLRQEVLSRGAMMATLYQEAFSVAATGEPGGTFTAAITPSIISTFQLFTPPASTPPAPKTAAVTTSAAMQATLRQPSISTSNISINTSMFTLKGLGAATSSFSLSPSISLSTQFIPSSLIVPASAPVGGDSAVSSMGAVNLSIVTAYEESENRRLCYLLDQPGCGRFAVNEDHGNDKAAQEAAAITNPLFTTAKNVASSLSASGNKAAYLLLLMSKLRACQVMRNFVNAKFGEYKATDYSDAVKRNNLRANEILGKGAELVAMLRSCFDLAKGDPGDPSLSQLSGGIMSPLDESAMRRLCFVLDQPGCGRFGVNEDDGATKAAQEQDRILKPLRDLFMQVAAERLKRGHATAYDPLVSAQVRACTAVNDYINAKFGEYKATDYSDAVKRNNLRQVVLNTGAFFVSCVQDAFATAKTGGISNAVRVTLVKSINTVAISALDAAVTRRLCYMFDQPGCGRFAVNEDHGNDKAAHEQSRVIAPLVAVCQQMAVQLAADGDAQAETALVATQVKTCTAIKNYVDSKYSEYHSVGYTDAVRRNNLRVGEILGKGREMVACFQSVRPVTPAGKQVLRAAVQSALDASKAREACYHAGSSGCGRFGVNEDDNNTKGRQERDAITGPLEAILASSAALGLGESIEARTGISPWAWAGVGAAAILVGHTMMSRPAVRRNRRRARSRRTSRRTSR